MSQRTKDDYELEVSQVLVLLFFMCVLKTQTKQKQKQKKLRQLWKPGHNIMALDEQDGHWKFACISRIFHKGKKELLNVL